MPELPPSSRPAFDLAGGTDFVAGLPLANPLLAEQKLAGFLDELLASPPETGTLLALLEQVRIPLAFIGDEMGKRFSNRPLELGEEEESTLQRAVSLSKRMARAYAICASKQEPAEENPQYAALLATVLHRCIYYTGCIITDHFRARRELPPGLWGDLHGYFDTAEQWGLESTPVNDALDERGQPTHCSAAYIALLLIDVAGPYSCSGRDLVTICRWARQWAPLVNIGPIDNEYETPPYVIELMKDLPIHPPGSGEGLGADARRLDTSRLVVRMNHAATQLRQHLTPSQLGLGEETAGNVLRLLDKLNGPWSQASAPRRFRRFASEGEVRVATSFEAIHFFVGGREFIQPDSAQVYSRGSFDELFTFRERAVPGQDLNIKAKTDYQADDWLVVNHSANGFRLRRGPAGRRVAHSQLLGLCPHDGQEYLLTQVTWLMQERSGGLVAGLAVLPGLPTAAAARHVSPEHGGSDRFVRIFMMPELPAVKEAASLVMPAGTYRASGVLDITVDDRRQRVRMLHVRQRGVDFERVTYETIDLSD
jgi:hypothetical protein